MTHVVNRRWKKKGKEFIGDRVNICRSSIWGNPFVSEAVSKFVLRGRHDMIVVGDPAYTFAKWLSGESYTQYQQGRRRVILTRIGELKGKVLVCVCKPQPCHGDVLSQLAENT